MKASLDLAVGLYRVCNGTDTIRDGYYRPEIFREVELRKLDEESLLKQREIYLKEILSRTSCLDPSECDCGILVSPKGERWFIEEDGLLGNIVLYSSYIKMVDELLEEKRIKGRS